MVSKKQQSLRTTNSFFISHLEATTPLKNQLGCGNIRQERLSSAFALMILVSMGEEVSQKSYTNNSQIIDKLCARMYSKLSETYTLTFMESFSGLSARVLQKEFNKRFGLSPFSWLNEQRLFRARDMLSDPNFCKNVSEVSRDCGFSHLGRFSVSFKRKFGVSANSFKNNK